MFSQPPPRPPAPFSEPPCLLRGISCIKKTRLRIIPAEKIASTTTTKIYIRFTYASSAALSFGLTSFALNSQPFLREHSIFPASPPRIFGATRGGDERAPPTGAAADAAPFAYHHTGKLFGYCHRGMTFKIWNNNISNNCINKITRITTAASTK